ncbi:MAG: hypothetical protein ACUVSZ_15870 [Chloroflexus sp.]|uniref:hypothetical protein n=1 Tax=Chloroflexus sp. TaxID=1904827 RepID=UPI00404AE2A5
MVLDRAGWHVSPRVAVPEGVRLICLPPSSPEVQPAERVWPVVNEAVANRDFQDLGEMMEVVAERCRVLQADAETGQSSIEEKYIRFVLPSGAGFSRRMQRPSGGTPSFTGGRLRRNQHERVSKTG